jgi:hypothetical protein
MTSVGLMFDESNARIAGSESARDLRAPIGRGIVHDEDVDVDS